MPRGSLEIVVGCTDSMNLVDSPRRASFDGFESAESFPTDSSSTGQKRGRCSGCCCNWKHKPLCFRSIAVMVFIVAGLGGYVYLTVPQAMISQRLEAAEVDIGQAAIEIGPNAAAAITPLVRFSVSKSVLALPLVSYTANVYEMKANIHFMQTRGLGEQREVGLGQFLCNRTITIDSAEDLNISITGEMTLASSQNIADMTTEFLTMPNITIGFRAYVDVYAKVYGWFPFPFYKILISKSLTIDGFDYFRARPIQLEDLKSAKGAPGQLNVSASVTMFNPSPVSVVLNDGFGMRVQYATGKRIYEMGRLYIEPPLFLYPGNNLPTGKIVVDMTEDLEPGMQHFMTEYIGPQEGFSAAGNASKPLNIRMFGGFSDSKLLSEVTGALDLNVNFRPKPLKFLVAITADVSALGGGWQVGWTYSVTCHVRVRNPLPQRVVALEIDLKAHLNNLAGELIYDYSHDLTKPPFVRELLTLEAFEEVTMDFPLSVVREVYLSKLFSPSTIITLLSSAANREMTMGVDLDMKVEIADGYLQKVHYENQAITAQMCFSLTKPKVNCGGVPPSKAALAAQAEARLERFRRLVKAPPRRRPPAEGAAEAAAARGRAAQR